MSSRQRAIALGVVLALAAPASVWADDPPVATPAPGAAAPTAGRRALAVAAAIVPGVIVRGAGAWVVGDRPTARRLLYVELLGLGLAAAGGLPIGLSRGAEATMPGLVFAISGGALLLTSWAADIHVAAGGDRLGGRPARPAEVTAELGYTFVGDVHLPIEHLATGGAELRSGLARARLTGWLGDGAWRAQLGAGARLWRPRAPAGATDATGIELEAALAREGRDLAGYAITSGEVGVAGRLDLIRLAAPLAGSFASLAMGVGVERVHYDAVDVADLTSLFAGRIGWGLYLGDGAGEVELYYQHRRDTLAGRITLPLSGNGFIGYVGGSVAGWRGPWGVVARLDVGSAYVASLALRWRLAAL